jgi:methionyl-tRNA formyltransferase
LHDAPSAQSRAQLDGYRVGEVAKQLGGRRVRLVRTSTTAASGIEVACGDAPLWIVEAEPAPE